MRPILFIGLLLLFSCVNDQQEKNDSGEIPSNVVESAPSDSKPEQSNMASKVDSTYVAYWCSIETLKKVDSESSVGNIVFVARLLATFHESCKDNSEYSEWANGLLFKTLKASPDDFLGILHKNDSLRKKYIIENLENPVNDGIDLKEVIEVVEKSNSVPAIKKEVKEALLKALTKK